VPLAPLVTVSQLILLAAVHVQPGVVVSVTVPVPPLAAIVTVAGETANAHAPFCVTVTVWPATVSAPVRDDVDVFAATV
jgi:hypothetical protein